MSNTPISADKIAKVPFPPPISVEDIVQMQLKNGIKNVKQTLNAFMIYRKEFIVYQEFKLTWRCMSKLASQSWKDEPITVKNYYKTMAKKVKEYFKERHPSLCFINSNQVSTSDKIAEKKAKKYFKERTPPLCFINSNLGSSNDGHISPETNSHVDRNPPDIIQSSLQHPQHMSMDQSFAYYNFPLYQPSTCFGSQLVNTNQISSLDTANPYLYYDYAGSLFDPLMIH